MKRKIIHIDEEKCNGCGICANACHEGAIDIIDGKAKLVREHFCDGLGDCLPACPENAITFEEREAPAYDEAAVMAAKEEKNAVHTEAARHQCPGSMVREMKPAAEQVLTLDESSAAGNPGAAIPGQASAIPGAAAAMPPAGSQLRNWPVQIKLAPISAPYFNGAKLLIAADCTAYSYASFHQDFIRGKVTLVGCPKLDGVDYSMKLAEIIRNNDIKSVTIVRMEVPCCGGLEMAAKKALQASGKFIPWQVVTISIDGKILE